MLLHYPPGGREMSSYLPGWQAKLSKNQAKKQRSSAFLNKTLATPPKLLYTFSSGLMWAKVSKNGRTPGQRSGASPFHRPSECGRQGPIEVAREVSRIHGSHQGHASFRYHFRPPLGADLS